MVTILQLLKWRKIISIYRLKDVRNIHNPHFRLIKNRVYKVLYTINCSKRFFLIFIFIITKKNIYKNIYKKVIL